MGRVEHGAAKRVGAGETAQRVLVRRGVALAAEVRRDEIGLCGCEQRLVVERRGATEDESELVGVSLVFDVDLEEGLDMVRGEGDRDRQHVAHALRLQACGA